MSAGRGTLRGGPAALRAQHPLPRGLGLLLVLLIWEGVARATAGMAQELGINLVAEGVETVSEARWLYRQGITHQQGYYFARPGLELLPEVPASCFAAILAEP